MRHRGSSKIKYEHAMIPKLRTYLETIQGDERINSIIPGRIKKIHGHHPLTLKITSETISGLKYLAYSGSEVQEVFVTLNR